MHNNYVVKQGQSFVKTSFDRVVSYDVSSLAEGLQEDKENKTRNSGSVMNGNKTVVVPRLKPRPITS